MVADGEFWPFQLGLALCSASSPNGSNQVEHSS